MVKDSYKISCRVAPITWTKKQFERPQGSIAVFAKELLQRNHPKGIDVDEEDVIHHWWMMVDHVFPKGDARRDQYIAQIDSPCLHDFWAEHRGHNEIPGQQDDGGFHRAQLSTNRAERRTHPGIVTMEKNGIEIVAPNVNLSALKHLEYRTFVREVLEANKSKIITLPDMQLLWDTIVYEMFGFECSCVKESRANDSMEVNGLSQLEYDQLLLNVGSGISRARPSILIPSSKRSREIETPDRSIETELDSVGSPDDGPQSRQRQKQRAYGESPSVQRQKRRSKRLHRSGPGDNSSIPGYLPLTSTFQSASAPQGQLPALPNAFARPATVNLPAAMPEQERLDPRLRSEPAMPATGQAVGSSSDPSTIPRSEEPDQVDGGSRPGDNREDGVRSLEFGASIGRH